jgi:glycosyltransferase involved in cell wall biosynthesis
MKSGALSKSARYILDYTPRMRKKLKDIKDEELSRERKRSLGQLSDNVWVKEIKEELIKAEERYIKAPLGGETKNAETIYETAVRAADGKQDITLLADAAVNAAGGSLSPELTEELALSFAQRFSKKKQILIEVTGLIEEDSTIGLRRVERNILINLLNMPSEDYEIIPVYFCYDGFYDARLWLKYFLGESATADKAYPPLIAHAGDILLIVELFTDSDRYISILRNFCLKGVEVKILVYDLLPIQVPWSYDKQFVKNFKGWIKGIVECSGGLCISQTTASILRDWIEANAPHRKNSFAIDVFPMGSDEENARFSEHMPPDAADILKKIAQKPSFILVSTVEPKKGHLQAIKAFDILWEREDINLVFVGKYGWLADKIVKTINRHKLLGEKLFWLTDSQRKDGVSDEYLNRAYAASACLIFPSAWEGFGLPIVEAARHGLPLILRDIPIFREIAGDNAYYFSGFEAEDLAAAIAEWLKLYREDKHPKSDDIKTYTWKESAEELLKILLR